MKAGWMLFAVLGLGAAGCSGVNEVAIADLSFKSFNVHVLPNEGRDSVHLDVWVSFDRPEGDDCYEFSSDTRATVADHVLTNISLGGMRKSDVLRYPNVCVDSISFRERGVPLSTTPTDTTIRIEDESGHIEMTVENLLVKRQVSFIEPADGVIRPDKLVRMLWTPDSDSVHSFGMEFVSALNEVHTVDDIDTHDARNGTVEFHTKFAFENYDTGTYLEPGTMIEGSLGFNATLAPKVISCGVEGMCTTCFQATPTIEAGLLQE